MVILDKAEWHDQAEVIVVGYGGGGGVAAVTAHDAGADVLIVEKQPAETHVNNTLMSGGAFISPTDVKGTEEYLRILAHVDKDLFWTDPEIIKVWAEYTCQNRAWVDQMGGQVEFWPGVAGAHRELMGNDVIKIHRFPEAGRGFMGFLKKLVNQRQIKTMHGTRARRLITNHRGEVIGVTVQREDGSEINLKATRSVILSTGGFEFNDTMKLQFLRCYPIYFTGSQANTGAGVKMAMSVGADLWHMNCCAAGFVMKFPELPFAFAPQLRGREQGRTTGTRASPSSCGYIIVDKTGHRFTNENFKQHHISYELGGYDSRSLNFPRIPAYWIMDRKRIEDGPLSGTNGGAAGPVCFYQWGEDNKTEIDRGWIISAEDISELGRKLGIDPENLKKTVENYNSYCRNGSDPELRRRPDGLVPLDTPPYYGVKLWPGGPNTQGGPRRNYKAQVVDVESDPIPGLYAAGELGSVFGMLYTGGGNLGECLSFGRIAGENAAREKPRSIS
ncbi:MAG: FAD-binding dehydrogenase [Dehalococcoidales bacterium]|nr:FAD-binding dehydrogenase [Dehalococcoidales bacterium]